MRKSEKGFASFMSSRRDVRRERDEVEVATGVRSRLATVAAAVVTLRESTMHCRAIDFSISIGMALGGCINRAAEAGDGMFCSKGGGGEEK